MVKNVNGELKYFDRNGKEITEGCMIKYIYEERIREIYRTENDELGIDATNPKWIESGRAVPCEFGIYPLEEAELEEIEVIE